MTKIKSPFLIFEQFISPLTCENIIQQCDFSIPDVNKDGKYIKTTRSYDNLSEFMQDALSQILSSINKHYDIDGTMVEDITVEWFPTGSMGQFRGENSIRSNNNWIRNKYNDLTGILFLSDFCNNYNIDPEYEVYGGKLEFIQHKFGFNPTRGTLIIFPSDPHFINNTSKILVGDLFQIRIHLRASSPYLYNSSNFPGNYTTWF